MRSLNQWSNQAWLTGRATTIGSTTGSSSFYYTTERVVALRSGRSATAGAAAAAAAIPTLYDASRETENCGVGLIASLKSVPSRDIVEKADEMLVRMAHRCGCDPASGDGSGTCVCACMCVCTRAVCVLVDSLGSRFVKQ
jgi:Glutamine amidotransferases class-II